MSDKPELIAAAQLNADPAGISFLSNFGFKTATRSSAGDYVLELDHGHNKNHLVVQLTRNNELVGLIQGSLPDNEHVQINNFNLAGVATDSPFFITVYHVHP
jgi:hypothetical protein